MIGLGGSIDGANIEVHDVQFVIAESKEEAFSIVKKRWYGDSLHVDSYTELRFIDGYQLDPKKDNGETVYLIVYGGYKPGVIDEVHEYHFLVADSLQQAKNLGKERIKQLQHIDHIDEVVHIRSNTNKPFGITAGDFHFADNKINHTFIKIK